MCKVIGVVSLKGGVGKTSVVTSLGDTLSSFGKKVLLIDGNFNNTVVPVSFISSFQSFTV